MPVGQAAVEPPVPTAGTAVQAVPVPFAAAQTIGNRPYMEDTFCVAAVGDGDALVREVAALAAADALPDIAVVDVRMPPGFTDEGLRAALTLRERHPGLAGGHDLADLGDLNGLGAAEVRDPA